jgi:starvation-inducible DNA-binding protein
MKSTLNAPAATRGLHPTRNDLPEEARARLVELLNARLADAIDLHAQAKQAHWNVKGPQFIALHELFDQVAETVEDGVDELAERAVQLGGTALGTLQAVGRATTLKPYPTGAADGAAHAAALADALAAYGRAVRAAIAASAELGDADTSDLFTGISRAVDKQLWFVEAHLQAAR